MLMNNGSEHSTTYRRLSGSTPSPVLRRSKSVRASFRMLGARWKSSSSGGGGGATKIDSGNSKATKETSNATSGTAATATITNSTSKDVVSERFGKDFNRIVKKPMTGSTERLPSTSQQLSQPILLATKSKSKLFHAFHAKENVNEKLPFHCEIPKNVAPKAAALLQIPVRLSPTTHHNQIYNHPQHQHRYQHRHQIHHPHIHHQQEQQQQQILSQDYKRYDLIKTNGNFNMNLDRNKCDLIANSKQFELLKSLSTNIDAEHPAQNNYRDFFKPATIRRTPYWTNNPPTMMHSKISLEFRCVVFTIRSSFIIFKKNTCQSVGCFAFYINLFVGKIHNSSVSYSYSSEVYENCTQNTMIDEFRRWQFPAWTFKKFTQLKNCLLWLDGKTNCAVQVQSQ